MNTALQLDGLDWVYLLSETELIAATEEGCFLYDFLAKDIAEQTNVRALHGMPTMPICIPWITLLVTIRG